MARPQCRVFFFNRLTVYQIMSNDFSARAPDFNLAMLVGQQRNPSVGAAWKQSDGSISIKLHPGVAIQSDATVRLRLFPTQERSTSTNPKPRAPIRYNDFGDDDIPF